MATWIVLPGGRIVRFRNRQTRHPCRRRRAGQPALGRGVCYPRNKARQLRRRLNVALQRALRECETLDEVALLSLRRV